MIGVDGYRTQRRHITVDLEGRVQRLSHHRSQQLSIWERDCLTCLATPECPQGYTVIAADLCHAGIVILHPGGEVNLANSSALAMISHTVLLQVPVQRCNMSWANILQLEMANAWDEFFQMALIPVDGLCLQK